MGQAIIASPGAELAAAPWCSGWSLRNRLCHPAIVLHEGVVTSVEWNRYPHLLAVVTAVESTWPAHRKALSKSLEKRTGSDLDFADLLSSMVLQLAPSLSQGLPDLVEDYRFLCERVILPEEIHFRRTGQYRLSSFEDAQKQVYENEPFMKRYMNGLLLSCVLWVNHARALQHYNERFLSILTPGAEVLEVGPGHGLLLCMACRNSTVRMSAWDVSSASLTASRMAARVLGIEHAVQFEQRDIFEPAQSTGKPDRKFDAVVMSEVLEHLEEPAEVLKILYGLIKPGGLIWINVPVNSPAPDHIFLLGHPEEARRLISDAGFEVIDSGAFPMNDVAVDMAVQRKLTISCAVMARRPAG